MLMMPPQQRRQKFFDGVLTGDYLRDPPRQRRQKFFLMLVDLP
jgi:hypothetical protein